MMRREYSIYKGLQKPLSYRGFKGKFIYWGIGFLVAGLAGGGMIGSLTNLFLGGLSTLAVIGGGLLYTFSRQKAGLHSKKRFRGICIYPVRLSFSYENKEKNDF